ncbi:putative methyltransferase-domain-containing protein [Lasiosphaeris hirsuta]|uniref:Methyltransferase-domain-containing protein n=1 Tax=Lasiosphaeris hirsuta TaxID=260670 RepID=A0AA40A3F1_9PEZI|nr:putative methyltransferase-domain-containing protein [Lasiosphaeris hirsuta]
MHYIRLLRAPTMVRGRSGQWLKLVVTITTDLGDAFLSTDAHIELSVVGAYHDKKGVLRPYDLTQAKNPRWQGGMRVLKVDLPIPPRMPLETIQIRATNRRLAVLGTNDVYPRPDGQALIMGVYADMPVGEGEDAVKTEVCFRSLRLAASDPDPPVNVLQVEEDFGDSIARHIWDGGVVTVSYIADMCLDAAGDLKPMPVLSGMLRQRDQPLNILELGCGVGIVGIGIARILGAAFAGSGKVPNVLMTDLQDAEGRARANISRRLGQERGPEETAPSIDFESLDWEEGKDGKFGEKVQTRPWDLVVVSECTYNTDTLLALVQTLSALHTHSAQHSESPCAMKIFLSTKPRHSSERQFFDLMLNDGWAVREKDVLPLPVLGDEAQSVEMYLFTKG